MYYNARQTIKNIRVGWEFVYNRKFHNWADWAISVAGR